MTQPQSRLSGGALGDTAGVARDPDAGATTFTSLPRDLVRISDVRSGGTHNDSRGARVTTRAVHAASALMVAEASRGVETRARKRKRELDAQAGVAFPGLPFDVAVSLVEKHLPDPADLAVLRAVSKGMRDAVDAIGRKVEEFKEDAAVERGYLSTLKCLRRRGRLSDVRLLCAAAAGVGDLEALKALRCAENFPWDERTCRCAAAGGHLRVLKWAHENDCPWNEQTCACAAQNGHLEVLKWARANDCPWHEYTCANAANGGHLEVLKWARENGCSWDEHTCAYAAQDGQLETLKWAHENHCPWNEWTCANAAMNGHLEVLKWAREKGCPWNYRTCAYAAHRGDLEMLKWVRENGCPWDDDTRELAANLGYVEE
jgi:hypothetical protein